MLTVLMMRMIMKICEGKVECSRVKPVVYIMIKAGWWLVGGPMMRENIRLSQNGRGGTRRLEM